MATPRKKHKYDPADSPTSVGWTQAQHIEIADAQHPFKTLHGGALKQVTVEYETYGTLNKAKDNAILITHALSGDAHVAGWDKEATAKNRPWRVNKPGWWDNVIGPGKAIDTSKFFVICMNVLGGCYGTTGPSSINPDTNEPYCLDFPMVTVSDWVIMEKMVLDKLGIKKLHAVCGGSLGGQQSLEWAMRYPDMMKKCIIMASAAKLSAQGLGFNAVARHAIMHDENFAGGKYYGKRRGPENGLGVARMLAHITYLSGKGMDIKFGREHLESNDSKEGFGTEFMVESYLAHQSKTFIERFDANSYLYITRAMDYYDAAANWGEGDLGKACAHIKADLLVASFSTDWLYPPEECQEFVNALLSAGKSVTYVEIQSHSGHDGFLIDTVPVSRLLKSFLQAN